LSLINRMLRDLSSRQPNAGNVMSGINVPPSATRRRGSAAGRLGLLVVLVAAFTAGLWWMFGPKPITTPAPRAANVTASAPASEAPAPAATPAEPPPASAPEQKPAHLKMDTELATAPAPAAQPQAAPAPEPEAAAPPPPRVAKPKPRPVEPAPESTAPAVAGPAVAETSPAPPSSGVTRAVPRTPKVEDLYAESQRAMQRGDYTAAETALIEALAVNPQFHPAREDLGTLRIRQGRLDEAESNVRIGLASDPAWVGYRRLLARLELARRRPAGAVAALENDPPPLESDTEYHGLLASAYQRLNRHEEASRSYRALAEVQPGNAAWWAGYAMSRDAVGDATGALAGYARARQAGGLDPRVLEHINRRTAVLQSAG